MTCFPGRLLLPAFAPCACRLSSKNDKNPWVSPRPSCFWGHLRPATNDLPGDEKPLSARTSSRVAKLKFKLKGPSSCCEGEVTCRAGVWGGVAFEGWEPSTMSPCRWQMDFHSVSRTWGQSLESGLLCDV